MFKKIIISTLAFAFIFLADTAFAALSCSVSTTCNSPNVVVLRMYATSNSHSELPSQGNYSQLVCCGGVTGLANSCTNTFGVVLRLSGDTNAHVEENTQSTATYNGHNACLSVPSGNVTIAYQNSNCNGFDTTVASISKTPTNAHIGDSNAYARKVCATASATSNNNNNNNGGGGGGGGFIPPPVSTSNTTVFSGRAYPNSTVVLLKDAQVLTSTVAGSDANFSISVNNLNAGNYIFSVYSEDYQGNRSSLLTFPVSVTEGSSTNIGGIFLAPTLSTDKSQVKKGDNITFFGQSIPNGEITIAIHSNEEIFKKVNSDTNGVYLQVMDSSPLELGDHTAKSKAARDGQISSYSKVVAFAVGNTNSNADQTKKCPLKGDLNDDCRVNLVDFSIAAYWYKGVLVGNIIQLEKTKLNGDGKINLVDFSIMAYYWTG
jgi:hypothetical protein